MSANAASRPGPFTAPFVVRVPASSANLGPGFDTLGMALTMYAEAGLGDCPPGVSAGRPSSPRRRRVRPLGRRRHAVGAFADPDGAWPRLQRGGPRRRCGGCRRAAARHGLAASPPAPLARSSPWPPISRATPTTPPPHYSVVWWRRRAAVRSACRSASIRRSSSGSPPSPRRPSTPATRCRGWSPSMTPCTTSVTWRCSWRRWRRATPRRCATPRATACTRNAACHVAPMSREALATGLEHGAWCGWLSGSGPTIAMLCKADAAAGLAASLPEGGHTKVLRIDHGGAVAELSVELSS